MDWDSLSVAVLSGAALVLYVDLYNFFRRGKFPYFIGRPGEALKRFIFLEMLAAILIMAVEVAPYLFNWGDQVFGVVAGLVEEPGKMIPVVYLARRNRFFREYLRDGGWFYVGIIAGLGFGIFEGILYSLGILANAGSVLVAMYSIVFGRATVVGLHAVFTMLASWGYGKLLNGDKRSFAVGLGSAMILHASYDFLVYTGYDFGNYFFVFAASLIYPAVVLVYLVMRRRVEGFYRGDRFDWLFRVLIISS